VRGEGEMYDETWPVDECPQCNCEYLFRQTYYEGKKVAGTLYTCKQCDWRLIEWFEDETINPEASIEAWEWWQAHEAHDNDFED
jgi:C4-type Zn-finger protein